MECHCKTISILESDIKVIDESITKLEEIKDVSGKISKDILDAANAINSNVNITNRYVLFNKLKEINKGEEDELFKIISEYESYKIKLGEKCYTLKISDKEYHEKEKLTNNSNTSE